jgi:hypothetical protein
LAKLGLPFRQGQDSSVDLLAIGSKDLQPPFQQRNFGRIARLAQQLDQVFQVPRPVDAERRGSSGRVKGRRAVFRCDITFAEEEPHIPCGTQLRRPLEPRERLAQPFLGIVRGTDGECDGRLRVGTGVRELSG